MRAEARSVAVPAVSAGRGVEPITGIALVPIPIHKACGGTTDMGWVELVVRTEIVARVLDMEGLVATWLG
jgi:hypothetical protein